MKGIILAGGNGTRLRPSTNVVSKQLLPIYDKPLIFYPLSVLMIAEIKEILIITKSEDLELYKKLFGNGSFLGLKIQYQIQDKPRGLADAFIIGEDFIGNDNVCLILGDNIFYGHDFTMHLNLAKNNKDCATVFGYQVSNPGEFGVIEINDKGEPISIEEKPKQPKSNFALTGLYFYDSSVINIAKNIKPSARGEIEITDINNVYLKNKKLKVEILGRGFAWLDTGTHETMLTASQFVQTIEQRQGLKIACLEEIAYNNNWISKDDILSLALNYKGSKYAEYLINIVKNL